MFKLPISSIPLLSLLLFIASQKMEAHLMTVWLSYHILLPFCHFLLCSSCVQLNGLSGRPEALLDCDPIGLGLRPMFYRQVKMLFCCLTYLNTLVTYSLSHACTHACRSHSTLELLFCERQVLFNVKEMYVNLELSRPFVYENVILTFVAFVLLKLSWHPHTETEVNISEALYSDGSSIEAQNFFMVALS